jgi:hypothetical protein
LLLPSAAAASPRRAASAAATVDSGTGSIRYPTPCTVRPTRKPCRQQQQQQQQQQRRRRLLPCILVLLQLSPTAAAGFICRSREPPGCLEGSEEAQPAVTTTWLHRRSSTSRHNHLVAQKKLNQPSQPPGCTEEAQPAVSQLSQYMEVVCPQQLINSLLAASWPSTGHNGCTDSSTDVPGQGHQPRPSTGPGESQGLVVGFRVLPEQHCQSNLQELHNSRAMDGGCTCLCY